MNTGSSTHGTPSSFATSSAIAVASRRSASNVPRLTSSASARATNAPISSADSVIDGIAPAASSTFAVNVCATALVMQCTRGARARRRVRMSDVMCGSSPARISTPSAGMTRIRFDGLAIRLSARTGTP